MKKSGWNLLVGAENTKYKVIYGIWCAKYIYGASNAILLYCFVYNKELIMDIVGYTANDVFVDFLKEATITCSLDELAQITLFFETAKNICEKEKEKSYCLHLRDLCKDWDSSSSDIIVLKV